MSLRKRLRTKIRPLQRPQFVAHLEALPSHYYTHDPRSRRGAAARPSSLPADRRLSRRSSAPSFPALRRPSASAEGGGQSADADAVLPGGVNVNELMRIAAEAEAQSATPRPPPPSLSTRLSSKLKR